MNKDIDKRKAVFTTTVNSTSNAKNDKLVFTNNKVLLCHFEQPKFNIALAVHVYDNAVAFGPHDFTAN